MKPVIPGEEGERDKPEQSAEPSFVRDLQSPEYQILDTKYIEQRDRLSYWREDVCQTLLNFSFETSVEHEFAGRLEHTFVSFGSISKLRTTPNHIVHRTKSDIARTNDEYFSLLLLISGNRTLLCSGKEHLLQPGQINLLRSDREFSVILPPGPANSVLRLAIPSAKLAQLVGFEVQTSISISQHLLGSALFSCLSTVNQRYASASRQELGALYDASTALLAASLLQDKEFLPASGNGHPNVQKGLLMAMQAFIDRDLGNPQLAVEAVSKQFGVSVRYVQKLFAEENRTFSEYLLSQRLERIYLDLLNPSYAHLSIAEMAIHSGLGDLSHFHRNFKAWFGVTPGELRAMSKT